MIHFRSTQPAGTDILRVVQPLELLQLAREYHADQLARIDVQLSGMYVPATHRASTRPDLLVRPLGVPIS